MTWVFNTPPLRPHGSQFVKGGPTGMCTLLAYACADIILKGEKAWVLPGPPGDPASVANVQELMMRVYREAYALGNCLANGGATQNGMIRQAQRDRVPVALDKSLIYVPGQELSHDQVTNCLRWNVAHASKPLPVLIQCAAGHALYDAETGQEDEADLLVHAYLVYGTQTDAKAPAAGGYICADGDNPGANAHPQIYSLATILQSRPISMLVFSP
jgi:hypothetical protein